MRALLLLLSACAGAGFTATADTARYPISLSPAVPAADGHLLRIGRGLKKVGDFHYEARALGIVYSAITIKNIDLSDAVNEALAQRGGVAVVNLRLASLEHCLSDYLFPLSILPIWPGCEHAEYTGDIVALEAP